MKRALARREPAGSAPATCPPRRPRRPLHVIAALLCALCVASCQALLGIDDQKNSAEALCELLNRCYITGISIDACESGIKRDIDAAPREITTSWLTAYSNRNCLESCVAARRCFDLPPLCDKSACDVREDCCGFAQGRADCDLATHQCCKPKGSSCSTSADCCPDVEGGCDDVSHTCGGVVCRPVLTPCQNAFECCTGICRGGSCAEDICFDDGFACESDVDCCSKRCEAGYCVTPACGVAGAVCEKDDDCCADDRLLCFIPEDSKTGVCSKDACLPDGIDCSVDEKCCSGHCDKAFFLCGTACGPEGAPCETSGQCCGGLCENGLCSVGCPSYCDTDVECCSGQCVGGVCAPECAGQCDGSVCVSGPPITASCGTAISECAKKVCETDSFCCCTAWDSLCVDEAISACGSEVCEAP